MKFVAVLAVGVVLGSVGLHLASSSGWQAGQSRTDDVAAVVADRLLAEPTPLDQYKLDNVSCDKRDADRREFLCEVVYENLAGDGPQFNGPLFFERQAWIATMGSDGRVARLRQR